MPPGTPSQTGEAFGSQFAFADGETPNGDWSDEALDAEASTEAPQEPAPAAPPEPPQQQTQVQEGQPAVPPAEGAQESEEAGEAPAQEAPPSGEGEAPEGETEAEKQERLYAGRYKSPEDLESGYKNIQALQKRTQEQRQRTELENQQLRAALQQLVPYLEEQQRSTQAPPQEVLDPTQLTAQQLQQMIEQQVAQRVGQATEQATQQTRQDVAQRDMRQAVESFMATHPDVAPGTPLDMAIGEVLEELQSSSEGRNFDQFPVTPTNLEVAYELAKQPEVRNIVQQLDLVPNNETLAIAKEAAGNPALAEVLLAQPSLVDTDHGMAYARKQAALPGMYSEAAQKVAAPSPEVARRAAYVETGGTGAPVAQAPGATPQDEMDEAIEQWNKGRDNIFGLAVD